MNLKIRKKSLTQINLICFILLSLIFLHVVTCLAHDLSAFNLHYLTQNIIRFKTLSLLVVLSIGSVWGLRGWSRYPLASTCLIITFEIILLLSEESNKLILFLLFLFVVISYYFYQLWSSELSEPFYNPNYDDSQIFPPMLRKISATLALHDNEIEGVLTNWNSNGVFINLLDNGNTKKFKKDITLKIEYNKNTFYQKASCISYSTKLNGIGLKFIYDNEDDKFNWGELSNIFNELGYTPGYLS